MFCCCCCYYHNTVINNENKTNERVKQKYVHMLTFLHIFNDVHNHSPQYICIYINNHIHIYNIYMCVYMQLTQKVCHVRIKQEIKRHRLLGTTTTYPDYNTNRPVQKNSMNTAKLCLYKALQHNVWPNEQINGWCWSANDAQNYLKFNIHRYLVKKKVIESSGCNWRTVLHIIQYFDKKK